MKSSNAMEIDPKLYKADFEVLDRYQGFSRELLRIATLGILAFAYLYKEVLTQMPSGTGTEIVQGLPNARTLSGISVVFFAVAAACALAHRYVSSDAMACQVRYLRLDKRAHTSEPPTTAAEHRATEERRALQSRLKLSSVLLGGSAMSLGLGILSLAVSFLGLVLRAAPTGQA